MKYCVLEIGSKEEKVAQKLFQRERNSKSTLVTESDGEKKKFCDEGYSWHLQPVNNANISQ